MLQKRDERKADQDQNGRDHKHYAHARAGLAGAGFVLIEFDVIADFVGGHGRLHAPAIAGDFRAVDGQGKAFWPAP